MLVNLMVHNRGRATGLLVALEMQLVLESSRGARSVTRTQIGGSFVSYLDGLALLG